LREVSYSFLAAYPRPRGKDPLTEIHNINFRAPVSPESGSPSLTVVLAVSKSEMLRYLSKVVEESPTGPMVEFDY
jgi:hypothetical protein